MRWLLAFALLCPNLWAAGSAAELGQAMRDSSFDPGECYRVRDISIIKDDLKIYLTDGHLIFAKPIGGRRIAAVFTADGETGDAEVILLPPNRAERISLAAYTSSPNLDEHIRTAFFLFTGNEYEAIVAQMERNPANRKDPAAADNLNQTWTQALRNLSDSFVTRVALDLLGGPAARPGMFAGMFQSARFGNFDIMFDPYGREQIVAGQVAVRDGRLYFDTWTSFEARSMRRRTPPRREDVIMSDYRIEATLQPDLLLESVTRVKVKSLLDGATAVTFEMSPQMAVASVTVDGRPAEVLQRDSVRTAVGLGGNQVFLVFPPEPLRAGRDYEFEFKHSGRVILDAGGHVFYVTARGNWYPTHNVQFARYDLKFKYPSEFDLVAAGDMVEDRTEGEWRTTRYRTPSAIRFAAFNLGHYEHARVKTGDYTVDVVANLGLEKALQPRPSIPMSIPLPNRGRPPGSGLDIASTLPMAHSPTERLQALAQSVRGSVEFMTSNFGPPTLPTLVVSPIPGTFGQGFPGMIYISTLAYLKDVSVATNTGAQSLQLYFDDVLQAHEVAHQWWGNRVTSTFYRDAWLMESLANMSALLYMEKSRGASSVDLMLDNYRMALLDKGVNGQTTESAGPVTFGSRLESSATPASYRNIIYGKGTWIIQMLRRRMGDERFLAMLKEVAKRFDHRDITTEDFRALAAEFLPPRSEDPQLENFFDQWVYGTGIPNLKLTYAVHGKAPALRLEGTLTQSEVDSSFSATVPIEIQVSRGQTITHWVRTVGDTTAFSVTLRQAPLKVTLDPHHAVLRRQ